jgi:hypothetical protein
MNNIRIREHETAASADPKEVRRRMGRGFFWAGVICGALLALHDYLKFAAGSVPDLVTAVLVFMNFLVPSSIGRVLCWILAGE